jgi:hypothetical protein
MEGQAPQMADRSNAAVPGLLREHQGRGAARSQTPEESVLSAYTILEPRTIGGSPPEDRGSAFRSNDYASAHAGSLVAQARGLQSLLSDRVGHVHFSAKTREVGALHSADHNKLGKLEGGVDPHSAEGGQTTETLLDRVIEEGLVRFDAAGNWALSNIRVKVVG